jgi:hypothetical protein
MPGFLALKRGSSSCSTSWKNTVSPEFFPSFLGSRARSSSGGEGRTPSRSTARRIQVTEGGATFGGDNGDLSTARVGELFRPPVPTPACPLATPNSRASGRDRSAGSGSREGVDEATREIYDD